MKARMAAAVVLVLSAGPALADGGVTVQLPDVSGLDDAEAERLIAELAKEGLRIKGEGAFLLRAVTHLDISAADIIRAAALIAQALENGNGKA